MTIETGGSAFPRVEFSAARDDGGYESHYSPGMDLRDYFAAAALQGICASGPTKSYDNQFIAKDSYNLADAMLAERSKS